MANISITFKAPFKYRFVCEHCGKQTDWLDASIAEQISKQSGFLENKEAVKLEIAREFWGKYPKKTKDIADGEYGIASELNGKCPACNSRQSWEAKTTNIITYLLVMFIAPLFGFVVLKFTRAGTQSLGALLRLGFGWVLVVFGGISFILLIADVIKKIKINADMSKTTARNKPEFDFPALPIEFSD